ncbi:MAG: 2-dehydropantoate 2-reductase, partial [Burkholderiaceae bacterium]
MNLDRICIVGLGAIGGFMAHRIAESGRPVSALARGATLAAVRRNGLLLRDASDPEHGRAVSIAASDSPAELGPQDLVILAVKTTALPSIPASISPLLGPNTVVLSAMNGVPWWFFHGLGERWHTTRLEATDPTGDLAGAIPPERVVGCVVHMGAATPEPGVVRHMVGDRFIVGEPGGRDTPRLAGKIKPPKPLPPIKPEEVPYELPPGWEWVRLGSVGAFERGRSKHRPRNDNRLFENGIYP